jgi:hypothetical protein
LNRLRTRLRGGGGEVPQPPAFTDETIVAYAAASGAAIYAPWDKSSLFTDTAATTPVTADGDDVRYIADISGNGHHLVVHDTDTPGVFHEFGGLCWVEYPLGCGFKTAGTKKLQLPTYLVAGLAPAVAADTSIFGVVRGAIALFVLRGHTTQDRIKSWLNKSPGGAGNNYQAVSLDRKAPLNAPLVADALAVPGNMDIGVNGLSTETATNTWTDALLSSDAVYGLNMASNVAVQTGTSGAFYGGLIMHANPGGINRARLVEYFRSKTDLPSTEGDFNMLVLGDSTGDEAGEWVYRFASERFAADDATAYVGYRLYDERVYAYGPEIVVQRGTGGPQYRVWNGSVSGRLPQYHTGVHFRTNVQEVPTPNVIWWNHGHNVAALTGASVTSWKGRFMGAMEQVRLQWPGVPHIALLQNPWRTNTIMTSLVAEVQAVADLYGDMPTADVHQEYLDFDPPKDSSLYAGGGTDNIHPSIPDGVDLFMDAVQATWTANWPMDEAADAFLATTATNLLTNGRFESVTDGIPDGWSLVGDGVCSPSTAVLDDDSALSIRIVNGASAATYLRQQISAAPYRGGYVTLAVRQYLDAGASNQTAGQIAISSDGTGTPTVANFAGLTTFGAGGWRWMVVQLSVPADANTLTVSLYASGVAGTAAGTVFLNRAVLVQGETPKDAA